MSKDTTNPAHAEIDLVANKVIGLYEEQRAYLDSKPTPYLEELVHRAEDQRNNIVFSQRVGAEVNLAAASMVLQARRAKS
jgi:hypothetical protein